MPLHIPMHAHQSLAHIITNLDTHTLKALNHPKAKLHQTKPAFLAPSTDPDTLHNIPYLHFIPRRLYNALERANSK